MWFDWLVNVVSREMSSKRITKKVDVVCRTKDGREFSPFSIEWKGSTLVLCENEESER